MGFVSSDNNGEIRPWSFSVVGAVEKTCFRFARVAKKT